MLVRIRYSHALRLVPGRELVERRVRLGVRLLHHVLGVGRVAGHPQRGRVELVEVLQGVGLEPGIALVRRLDGDRPRRAASTVERRGWYSTGMLITYESTGDRAAHRRLRLDRSRAWACLVQRGRRPAIFPGSMAAMNPVTAATSDAPRRSAGVNGDALGQPVPVVGARQLHAARTPAVVAGRRPDLRRPSRSVSLVPCSTSRGTVGREQLGGPGLLRPTGQVQREGQADHARRRRAPVRSGRPPGRRRSGRREQRRPAPPDWSTSQATAASQASSSVRRRHRPPAARPSARAARTGPR